VPGVQADDYGRVLPREWSAGLRGVRRQSERADAEGYACGVCARDAFRRGRRDCGADCLFGVWNCYGDRDRLRFAGGGMAGGESDSSGIERRWRTAVSDCGGGVYVCGGFDVGNTDGNCAVREREEVERKCGGHVAAGKWEFVVRASEGMRSQPAPSTAAPENGATNGPTAKATAAAEPKKKFSVGAAIGGLVFAGLASPFLELGDEPGGIIGLVISFCRHEHRVETDGWGETGYRWTVQGERTGRRGIIGKRLA